LLEREEILKELGQRAKACRPKKGTPGVPFLDKDNNQHSQRGQARSARPFDKDNNQYSQRGQTPGSLPLN